MPVKPRARSSTVARRVTRARTPPAPVAAPPSPPPSRLALLARPRTFNLALVLILLLGAWFRFHGLNWDEGHHLHPDERFLSSVTNDIKWPQNFNNYFDPVASTLSPYSLPNMGLFVYGTLPVYVVKWTAILINDNNYDKITLIGRALSGLFDLAAIWMLFLIARRLYGKGVALLAAGLLALSVFNIQLSHFYAVDTYANLFIVATMYFLILAADSGRWLDYLLTGVMFGLGLASKVSVLTMSAPILLVAGMDYYRRSRSGNLAAALEQTIVRLLTVVVVAAVTFRVAQPIAYAGPGFWNWSFNARWLRDIVEQQKTVSGLADQPWIQQWTDRSFLFPLYNIAVWGLGLPLGIASLAGFALAGFELLKQKRLVHLLPVVYVTVTFIYHAATFVKFMRYFLPIYPFLVLFAAYLMVSIWKAAFAAGATRTLLAPRGALTLWGGVARPVAIGIGVVVIGGTLAYAAAFSSIYSRTNTRVAASRWMYQNMAVGSTLANEHWDDWLPIGGLDGKNAYGNQGMFKSVEMANYEDDNPAKLDKMVQNLSSADYIVLSSNRLYDSIPRLPMRYPMTIRYYQMLFDGRLGFERIATFSSYPQLLGLQLPDQVAEESFSVYDHPKVQIFRKTPAFNPTLLRAALGLGIAWDNVVHVTPLQATQAPTGLELTSSEQAQYQRAALSSSSEVNPDSLGSRLPLLAWIVALSVLGLLALPLTVAGLGHLADRGYMFSKALGLLLVAWAAWLVASVRLAPFTWWLLLVMIALLAAVSAWMAARRWPQLRRFLRARWRLLLFEEVLFWLFFALLLFVRFHNPDLWHPGTGGEKPMDLAYLNAIVRTPYFPSYDPWFSGGYINYYYFGFVLVAALVHLTGIVPYIAYNLAVPTFFAMTALGGFAAALNLAQRTASIRSVERRNRLGISNAVVLAGVCGALFVAVIGNLAQVKLIWDGIISLSTLPTNGDTSPLMLVARLSDGLNQWIGGHKLPIHTDWWYWNATRVIPAAKGEAGPINEMPFFTFLFADLHAHAMALPYTLLALVLSLNVVLDRAGALTRSGRGKWWPIAGEGLTLAFLALTTGALWPMNTWDFPTYTLLAAAALTLRELGRRGRIDLKMCGAALWRIAVVVVGGWLLFLPFHRSYASAYFGAELWKGSLTPLWAYLLIHGFFLFVLVSYLLAELLARRTRNALVRSLRLNFKYRTRLGRLRRLFNSRTKPTSGYRLGVALSQLALVIVLIVLLINPVLGVAFGLSLLAALLLWCAASDPRGQFMFVIIGLGLFLTGVVEIVVLKGDISRMNTVFKFYLQVWVLWSVVSAAALPELAVRLARRRNSQDQVGPAAARQKGVATYGEPSKPRPVATWSQRWWWAFGILLGACFLYPLTATPVRAGDRFPNSTAVTLDGSAYMRTSVYFDDGRPVTLEWDRQAIDWLRRNAQGIPTILEANTPLYRWGSRVSINTGFPTVIGWDWHQKQQRSVLPGQLIDLRIQAVRTIYNSTDPAEAIALLKEFNVRYVYVGALERLYYDPAGLAKFDQTNSAWGLVYHNDQINIYQVR